MTYKLDHPDDPDGDKDHCYLCGCSLAGIEWTDYRSPISGEPVLSDFYGDPLCPACGWDLKTDIDLALIDVKDWE